MSWEGSGTVVLHVGGVAHTFPRPRKGGREQTWKKEVDRTRKTILGEVVRGEQLFRFVAKYTWGSLTDEQVALLQGWDNEQLDVVVQPHADRGTLRVPCRIVLVDTKAGENVHRQQVVTVEFEALSLRSGRLIPVDQLQGFGSKPKKGVIA